MMKRFGLVVLTCSLVGCRASSDEPLDTPEQTQPEEAQQLEVGETPADVDAIASLLRARHVKDLPDAEALSRYPTAEASLRYLAETGDTMVVRTRALSLLQYFSSEPTGALLIKMASDKTLHPALRAAAITGLAGQPLDRQPERLEVVIEALRDEDPRVGVAAVEVLGEFEVGRQALRDVKMEEMSPAVREAIESKSD
jgi:HEAT repeat protein